MGRHQPLPSGSLQQAPVPTSATREADTEIREVKTVLSAKRAPHQKPIKMKRQTTVTQIREKQKNLRKNKFFKLV